MYYMTKVFQTKITLEGERIYFTVVLFSTIILKINLDVNAAQEIGLSVNKCWK